MCENEMVFHQPLPYWTKVFTLESTSATSFRLWQNEMKSGIYFMKGQWQLDMANIGLN